MSVSGRVGAWVALDVECAHSVSSYRSGLSLLHRTAPHRTALQSCASQLLPNLAARCSVSIRAKRAREGGKNKNWLAHATVQYYSVLYSTSQPKQGQTKSASRSANRPASKLPASSASSASSSIARQAATQPANRPAHICPSPLPFPLSFPLPLPRTALASRGLLPPFSLRAHRLAR